jgi:hypothetical protein
VEVEDNSTGLCLHSKGVKEAIHPYKEQLLISKSILPLIPERIASNFKDAIHLY